MDEMFIFRPYIEVLIQRWRLLLGGALVAGILATGLSFLLPPTYQAQALVLIVDPTQLVQFDPRFETVGEIRPRQVYPVLASSDSLLQTLLQNVTSEVDKLDTLNGLRDMVSVSTSRDPSLLELRVEHHDPVSAALIANRWAELFIIQANQVIGDQDVGQIAFYIQQRDLARLTLGDAEQVLAEFQAVNRLSIVKAQLASHKMALAAYLAQQHNLILLQQDIIILRTQLLEQNGPLSPADQLALILIYGRIYGGGGPGPTIEWQIDSAAAPTVEREQIVESLDTLQTALITRSDNLVQQMSQLEPAILGLQQELQVLMANERQLQLDAKLASETHTALVRQLAAEQIISQDTSRGLRLASPAIIPQAPVAPQKILNGLLAAMVAFVSLAAVLLFRRWQTA